MIIVSAHEKGWAAKLLLYSDVDDFARRSTTPVLVYRKEHWVLRFPSKEGS
jgi:hypothetical protein